MKVTRYTVDANCYPRFKSETRRLLDISQRLDHVWTDTFGKTYPTNVHDSKIETDLHNENVELFLCKENTAKELSSITGNDMVLQNQGVRNRGSYIYDDMKTFLAGNKHLFNSTTVMVVPNNTYVNDIMKEIVNCKTIIVSDSSKQNLHKQEKTYEEYTHVKVSTEDKVAADICSMLERTAFEPMQDKFKSVKGLLQGISPFTRGSKSCTDVTPEIPVYNKVTLDDENIDDKATYVQHTRSKAEETLRPEVKRKLYALANGDSLQRNETEKGIKRKSDDFEKRTNIITNGKNMEYQAAYVLLQTRSGKLYRRLVDISQQEGEYIENQAKYDRKIRSGTIIQSETGEGSQAEGGNVENQTTYLRQTRSGKFLSTLDETIQQEGTSAVANGDSLQRNRKEKGIKRKWDDLENGITITNGTSSVANGDSLQRNKTEKGIKRKRDVLEKGITITNGTSTFANGDRSQRNETEMGTIITWDDLERGYNFMYGENMENSATYVRQTRSGKFLSPTVESLRHEEGTAAYLNGGRLQRNKTRTGSEIKFKYSEKRARTVKGMNMENHAAYVRQNKRGELLSQTDKDDFGEWKSKFLKNKHKFQRLFGEMIGMYKRSKLPEEFKPSLNEIPKEEVSQQMLSDLYNISGSIKGYAYRFCTRLQIFVLEVDIEKLKPKIAEILENYGISQDSCDIVPPIDAVTPHSKLHVGAKVKLNEEDYGSLTGFVKMQKGQQGEDKCAIASKHLLDGRKTVYLVNEKVKITADVVPETAPGDSHMEFDIAVAKVRKDDEKHCEGQFKNESGTFMKGMVCSYSDDQLEGQHVHINGASTAKGLGIISMTHFEERKDENENSDPNKEFEDNGESNQNEKFIVIEDRVEDAPFCKEGDSGSMVCADDEDGNHVQLISTVIGERTTNSYQTLRLTKGIAHLEKQTQSKIDFFE